MIAEYLRPPAELQVTGHNGCASLVPCCDQIEEKLGAISRKRYESQLIQDENIHPLVVRLHFAQTLLLAGFQQLVDQSRCGDKADTPSLPEGADP